MPFKEKGSCANSFYLYFYLHMYLCTVHNILFFDNILQQGVHLLVSHALHDLTGYMLTYF